MTKIVINACYGGFSIPDELVKELGMRNPYSDVPRDHHKLVEYVESEKYKASGCHALKVVEIPDDVDWQIEEYDGNEWVSEVHRTWE